MSNRIGSLKSRALMTSSAAVLGVALASSFGSAAWAQNSSTAQQPAQEIVVTGSRIVRRDYTSNSPIITLNSQAFENTSNQAIEATLNKLPQFNPAQNLSGVSATDVQPTAGNTIGISAASLRGLGPNRNLVLVDGKRMTPVNAALIVDLNSIPSSMIDRVETITGGASAVYGADAVGGVVNFILKKNFQGFEFDTQYGETQVSDGQEFKASALMGANFADDRGNVTFGIEHFSRSASYQKNRDFYTNGWKDPTTATNIFFTPAAGYSTQFGNTPTLAAVNTDFNPANRPAGHSTFPIVGTTFAFNPDCASAPTTCQLWANNVPGFVQYQGPINQEVNGTYFSAETVGDTSNGFAPGSILKGNGTGYFVTAPLTRYSMYGQAQYHITDSITASIRGNFEQFHTHTLLFPSPFIFGWTATVPYDAASNGANAVSYCLTQPATIGNAAACSGSNLGITQGPPILTTIASPHPVPTALATLLNSRPNPNADWAVSLIPPAGGWFPSRQDDVTTTVWQVAANLSGKLPIADWTWELDVSEGQASSYDLGSGYASLARFQALLRAPNFGQNAGLVPANSLTPGASGYLVTQGNLQFPSANGGFGAASPGLVHCTSGFAATIFSGGTVAPSKDCIDAINAPLQNRTATEQRIVELDFQGKVMDLPGGEMRASFGGSYRENSILFTPDILQGTSSFTDQVVGVYPASGMDASLSAREGYGELLIPIAKDLPFAKNIEFDPGVRYSTYDVSSATWTYKGLARWDVNDFLSFRGGYQLATRAPNLYELDLGLQEVFAGGANTVFADPCTIPGAAGNGTNAPYGANHNKNATNAANALAICEALMGGIGSSGVGSFYNNPAFANVTGTPTGFIFTKQFGNPNLRAETGKTWTAGLVLKSPFDLPLLHNMQLTADWYSIRIDHAIEIENPDDVRAACLSQNVGATAVFNDANSGATAASVTADPALLASVLASAACQKLERNPVSGGDGDVHLQFNNAATIRTSGVDITYNWGADFAEMGPMKAVPGSLNVNVNVSMLNYYDTQATKASPWIKWKGSLGPTLNGTNAGAYDYRALTTLSYAVGPASVSLTWTHLPGVIQASKAIAIANGVPASDTTVRTSSYELFNLAGSWSLTDNLSLRAGVDNLFDKTPPITGANTGITPPSFFPTSGAGLTNATGTTSAFYYDVLGRRFYMGAKLKF